MRHLTTADVAGIIDRSPVGRLQVQAIVLCLLVAMIDGFDTQAIAFVAPSIGKQWGADRSAFGPVFSAGLFGAMIGSLFISPLGDRFGRRPMIIAATIGFAAFSILCGFAHGFAGLIVLRVLAGLGLGAVYPNLIAIAFEYAPRRKRTLLTTIVSVSLPPGGLLGGLLSTILIPRFGWPSVFVAGGILPLLLLPWLFRALPESIRFLASRPDRADELRAILRRIDPANAYADGTFSASPDLRHGRGSLACLFTEGRAPSTLVLWLVFVADLFTLNFMINWLPSVVNAAGLSITQAILTTTMFNFGQMTGALAVALAIDRARSYAVLPLAYLGCAIAVGAVGIVVHAPVALFLAIFLGGAGLTGGFAGINVIAGTLYPTTARATGIGWAYGIGRVGSVLGPIAGGIIVSLGWSIRGTFLFGAVPALVATIGTVWIVALVRKRREDTSEVH